METQSSKAVRNTALIISLSLFIIYVCSTLMNLNTLALEYGLHTGSGRMGRLTYSLLHRDLLHLLLNVWCLLSVVFARRIPLWAMALAFVLPSSIPTALLSDTPTIGFSGVCYFLYGYIATRSPVLTFYIIMVLINILGYLLGSSAFFLHIYAFVWGFIVYHIEREIRPS